MTESIPPGTRFVPLPSPFAFKRGGALHGARMGFETWGTLAAALPPGATLFVFARPVDGAGPPVAAERVAAATFPAEVTLSDADSLMPTAKLSQLDRVEVVARLSASGDAAAATGDLESAPQVIAVEAGAKIALTLDRIHE